MSRSIVQDGYKINYVRLCLEKFLEGCKNKKY